MMYTRGEPQRKQVRALYSYRGEGPNDLSFQAGDIIDVVSEDSMSGPEWWNGETRGVRGSFPLNHVEVIQALRTGFAPSNPFNPKPFMQEPPTYNPSRHGTIEQNFSPPPKMTPVSLRINYPQNYPPPSSQTKNNNNQPTNQPANQPPPYNGANSSTNFDCFDDEFFKYKVGLFLTFSIFIFLMFALFVPWYFTFTQGQQVQIWQFTGVSNYIFGTINLWFAPLNVGTGFQTFVQLGFNNINTTMAISLAFLVFAFVVNLILAGMYFQRIRLRFESKSAFLFISFVLSAFLLISTMQFLAFGNSFKMDNVIPNCAVGPCISFSGTSATMVWGPGFGWIAAMVALGPAIGTFFIAIGAMRESAF